MHYTIKNILFATDLGPRGPEIFRCAASLAERYGADIHIVHAVEPPQMFRDSLVNRYVSPGPLESFKERGYAEALMEIESRLEKFCRTSLEAEDCCHARVAGIRVLEGAPAQTILREADRVNADCVVLGSNRYSALGEMVVGSVARKVTLKSRRPVFLVPI